MSRNKTPLPQILDAALTALEQGDGDVMNMAHVARLAGISRQALYLHFDNRADLAMAIARYSDEKYGVGEALRPVITASSGEAMLDELARFLADFNPKIYPVVRMADALRRGDADMAAAWDDRVANRRRGMGAVVKRLNDWGELAPGWTVRSAADWLTSMASAKIYEEQVLDLGVSLQRYRQTTALALKRALLTSADAR